MLSSEVIFFIIQVFLVIWIILYKRNMVPPTYVYICEHVVDLF